MPLGPLAALALALVYGIIEPYLAVAGAICAFTHSEHVEHTGLNALFSFRGHAP